jgi:thioredoxin 1
MIKQIKSVEDFKEVINGPAVLMDFFATWCGPCKMLHPVLESLSEKEDGNCVIAQTDIDQFPDIAGAFKIQSVPTMIFFANGKAIAATSGYQDEARLAQFITAAKDKAASL